MDGSEEVARGFVVARGDGSILFQLGEEVLNQVPSFVEMAVEVAWYLPVGLWRYHRDFAGSGQPFMHPRIGIERFIGDEHISLHIWQKMVRTEQVVRLAAGQVEADRIAQGIDKGVDLGAQSAA